MLSFEQKLDRYAELAVKVGANVQPGQIFVISAMIDTAEFVRLLVRKGYEAGAKKLSSNMEMKLLIGCALKWRLRTPSKTRRNGMPRNLKSWQRTMLRS